MKRIAHQKKNKQTNNFVTEIHQIPKELCPNLVAQLLQAALECVYYMGSVVLNYIVDLFAIVLFVCFSL